ncbi:type IX secretion system sortase PorU [candidate division KSB1 bacterium]|nr:type IX secretion system sortase PorU [candidate division KSB1 bacterium]
MKYRFASIIILFCTSLSLIAQEPDIKILSQDRNNLTLEFTPLNWSSKPIEIDGKEVFEWSFYRAEALGNAGGPAIPARTLVFGIPIDGNATVTVLETDYLDTQNSPLAPVPFITHAKGRSEPVYSLLESTDWTKAANHPLAELSEPRWFRNQRIVNLLLKPLHYHAGQQRVRRYTRLVVHLEFSGSAPSLQSQPPRPHAGEQLYKSLLVNDDQARQWRKSEALPTLAKRQPQISANQDFYRIVITGDRENTLEGMYKIDGKTLSEAGVPTASLDPGTLQLFNNGGRELPRDVDAARPDSLIENPILVIGGQDGRLDADDYILFYGRSVTGYAYDADERRFRHYINHYTDDNVYWLTFGNQQGKRIQDVPSQYTAGMAVESSFTDLVFSETEQHNMFNSGFIWFGPQLTKEKNSFSHSFAMPGALPGETAQFRVQMAVTTTGNHQFSFLANGNELGTGIVRGGTHAFVQREFIFDDTGSLRDGDNNLTVQYYYESDISVSHVDWMEIEYQRAFQAHNDQLIFHAPVRAGSAAFEITNFGRNDIQVYDVTDIGDIRRITSPFIADNTVRFTAETDPEQPKRLIALTPGAYRRISEIKKQEYTDLRTTLDTEYIIITHDDFYSEALKLEGLRETLNPDEMMQTTVVKISDVYESFSWGLVDATALRDFMVYAESHWGQPGYVLLLGDGHFDYKNLLGYDTPNLILPYESSDRFESNSRTTDDWFTYTKGDNNGMQMAIGRIPAQTLDQARAVVNKIIAYETDPAFGNWRKTVTIVGDDELVTGGKDNGETLHTQQSETLAELHVPPLLDVEKIYLMEYTAVRTASVSGITKPTAAQAILDRINRGTLIINYIGHGNDELWSHERVLTQSNHFHDIQNGTKMALWVAATCEFAWWDQPQKQSFAEMITLVPERGSVAMVSSARLAYSFDNAYFNYEFYDQLFKSYGSTGLTSRLGDAVMIAKQASSSRINSEKYNLFGDPTMRLGAPQYRAVIESVSPDSLQALRKMEIKGYIERNGQPWNDFQGNAYIEVMDSRKAKTYTSDGGRQITYVLPGNTVYKGGLPIENGRFSAVFIVPKDINYGGKDGRISIYFNNDSQEGTAFRSDLVVGGTAVDLIDRMGPEIALQYNQKSLAPGDYIASGSDLTIILNDSLSGLNITGDIGHEISLTIDDNESESVDITDLFQYDPGSYTTGKIHYPMPDLEQGTHTLQIKAWDNSNNSATLETTFTLVSDSIMTVRNLLNYPNPMNDQTQFTFELSQDAEVKVKIFTVSGRLVRELGPFYSTIGFNTLPLRWDGTDQDGDPMANGVYLYRLQARSQWDQDKTTEKIGKLIISR